LLRKQNCAGFFPSQSLLILICSACSEGCECSRARVRVAEKIIAHDDHDLVSIDGESCQPLCVQEPPLALTLLLPFYPFLLALSLAQQADLTASAPVSLYKRKFY